MTRDDALRFRQLVNGVCSFYGKEVSEFQLDVWWTALRTLDYEAVKDAFNRHLLNPDNGQFMPKPADVVKLIGGGTADRALVAWTKLDLAVRNIGPQATVVFDDPIIHQVVDDMGGWTAMGEKTEKDWPFAKNEFVQRYRSYATGRLASYPAKLIGYAEAHNALKWPERVPAPRYVGDRERAAQVLLRGATDPHRRMKQIGELLPQLPAPT